MLFLDTRIGESGFKSNRRSLAHPFPPGGAELSGLRGGQPYRLRSDEFTNSRAVVYTGNFDDGLRPATANRM